jgi:hypothetical protein
MASSQKCKINLKGIQGTKKKKEKRKKEKTGMKH